MKIDKLIFPVDFYILKTDEHAPSTSASILFGRPFMKIAKTKIDIDKGQLPIEFDDQVVTFNLFNTVIHPESSTASICQIDIIDSVVHDVIVENECVFEQDFKDESDEIDNEESSHVSFPNSLEINAEISTQTNKLLPSVVQAPKIELKPLPEHLKYVYSGHSETLSIIISKELTAEQEVRLIQVLKENKLAIGWTLVDIKGISPPYACTRF